MGIVQKLAGDLKIGDILAGRMAGENRVMPRAVLLTGEADIPQRVRVRVLVCETGRHDAYPVAVVFMRDELVDVSVASPALTQAQEHAEELADLVRAVSSMGVDTQDQAHLRDRCRAMRAKIDPPEPTLADALDALYTLSAAVSTYDISGSALESARKLLDRARDARLLK